jgi:hypothetical protein
MSVGKLIQESAIIRTIRSGGDQRRNRHRASIVRSHSAGGLSIFASLPPNLHRIWRPLARQRDLVWLFPLSFYLSDHLIFPYLKALFSRCLSSLSLACWQQQRAWNPYSVVVFRLNGKSQGFNSPLLAAKNLKLQWKPSVCEQNIFHTRRLRWGNFDWES